MKKIIKFAKVNGNAVMPVKAHKDDAGFDVVCTGVEKLSDRVYRCRTGLRFEFPENVWATFVSRSSVWKTGWILSNGTGIIDNGYRGEIMGVFYEIIPSEEYQVGDRFAQLIIQGILPEDEIEFVEVPESELGKSERGTVGYGSSGK